MMKCEVCGKELSGGLDTYGDVGHEICEDCFLTFGDDVDDCWYGVAPHHHDFVQSGGGWIGSTVLDPLPAPDENGDILLPDGRIFHPDDETDGACGMYFETKAARNQWHNKEQTYDDIPLASEDWMRENKVGSQYDPDWFVSDDVVEGDDDLGYDDPRYGGY